jgi:hypothetical protein
MTAYDGLPFHLFCTSGDVRKGMTARGFFSDVPKSPATSKKWYWIKAVLFKNMSKLKSLIEIRRQKI